MFNPQSGLCDNQKNVEGCEDTYPQEPADLDLEVSAEYSIDQWIHRVSRLNWPAKFGIANFRNILYIYVYITFFVSLKFRKNAYNIANKEIYKLFLMCLTFFAGTFLMIT